MPLSRGRILGISNTGGQLLTTVMCVNVPPSVWHYRSLVPLSISTLQEQVIYGAAITPWMSPPNTRHSRQSAAAGWTQVIVSPHSSAPVSSWPDPGTIQHSDHRHQSWVGCPPGNSATTNTSNSNSNNTLASHLATLETLKSDAPHRNKMKQVINVN